MVDTVTSQLLFNGPRHWAYRFTNVSDATGEAGVTKIDATSGGALGVVVPGGQTQYPGVHLKITKIRYSVLGMSLRVQFHATANADALILSGSDLKDFTDTGGIQNPGTAALAGSTGSIDFTTVGAASGSTYSVEIEGTKGLPQ